MRHSPNRRNIVEDKKQTSFSSFVLLPTSSQRSSSSDKPLLPFQRIRSSSLLTSISQRNTEGHRRQRAVTLGDFSRVHGSGSLLKPGRYVNGGTLLREKVSNVLCGSVGGAGPRVESFDLVEGSTKQRKEERVEREKETVYVYRKETRLATENRRERRCTRRRGCTDMKYSPECNSILLSSFTPPCTSMRERNLGTINECLHCLSLSRRLVHTSARVPKSVTGSCIPRQRRLSIVPHRSTCSLELISSDVATN